MVPVCKPAVMPNLKPIPKVCPTMHRKDVSASHSVASQPERDTLDEME
jgi:hypothetical protein